MREITRRRVTIRAMPVTIEERRAFSRVTRNQVADLVGETIRDIGRTRMQKGRDIGNLLRGKCRESRHRALWPATADNGTEYVTFVVVQHHRRTHEIRPALSMGIIAVTESAR